MTTRGLEDLDGGLGSCLPRDDDFPFLEETCPSRRPEHKARGSHRLADSSSWPHDPVTTGAVDGQPKKTEKELVGTSKKPKAGESGFAAGMGPRSAPVRKKSQPWSPLHPPPPPGAPLEDLPWGDLTLNKCLVLASLVALLGSAFQLCWDMVTGEAVVPAPAPQPWVPPSSPPKKPVSSPPKPPSEPPTPKPGPPGPRAETENRTEIPRSPESAEVQRDPGKTMEEDSGEEPAPLQDGGSQERPRKEKLRKEGRLKKEERPRKERPRQERPRQARPQKERQRKEKPRATREPQEALPRCWEARESRNPEHWKRRAWAFLPCHARVNRPLGGQKHHGGKGHD
ncbi:junctional sarcoplasmic reticulum protein 1 isoform X2 [Nannospalax galili]|uniref:junctional sarcoplasmic reticulum protein 1 isoform X2 n=1 Tax=Nannospalax galili TaxID=1026970 RepID=UPI00111C26E3|nr:junctional sarcoplasmic reticulum protein 1 isoform X2 [Nannospalax galili]